ncbi:hypothetical protein VNO77_02509 [Canavalia gladiata]|uniref:Uncharacterized protein n=1 Tax=Canavalia gladiata TaxID=3824 RepID=A0AAN9MY45_CANGL
MRDYPCMAQICTRKTGAHGMHARYFTWKTPCEGTRLHPYPRSSSFKVMGDTNVAHILLQDVDGHLSTNSCCPPNGDQSEQEELGIEISSPISFA